MEGEENTSKERIGGEQKPKKEDRYKKANKEQHEEDEQRWTQMLQVICIGDENIWQEEAKIRHTMVDGRRREEDSEWCHR